MFDPAEAESDGHRVLVLLRGKLEHTPIEVGRMESQSHPFGLINVEGNFVGVIDLIA